MTVLYSYHSADYESFFSHLENLTGEVSFQATAKGLEGEVDFGGVASVEDCVDELKANNGNGLSLLKARVTFKDVAVTVSLRENEED